MKTVNSPDWEFPPSNSSFRATKQNKAVTFSPPVRPIHKHSINIQIQHRMKNTFTLVLLAFFSVSSPAQELDSLKAIMDSKQPDKAGNKEVQDTHTYSPVIVTENDEGVNIKLGDKDLFNVHDNNDSTRIRVGNREISIVEKDNKADIHIGKVKDQKNRQFQKFRGHWAGFEWGINNLLDNDFTLSREGDASFMDMDIDRSWCINLNFAQYSLGFGSSYIGLLTGIGLQYNNYYFDNANSLAEVDDYVVTVPLDEASLTKSKLTASLLRIPLILEGQFPRTIRSKRMFVSVGLVTTIKLDSHAKVVTEDSNGKKKDKNNDDFNMSPFRYGLIGRLGFGMMSVYGEYYFTPLFIDEKGPELYPFSLGLAFSF
jgi:hypothetical protein